MDTTIDLGHYYTLRSSVINAYKKSDLDSYDLIETTQRNYYDYGVKISGEIYGSIFNIGNCYDSKLKETFALNFKCRSSKVNTGTISASRIVNIDVFSIKMKQLRMLRLMNWLH
uniref:Uncharacterized protein n=1 Tax=Tetranychus urticae TaxID=32264 RepID=T1JTQ7_TETUR